MHARLRANHKTKDFAPLHQKRKETRFCSRIIYSSFFGVRRKFKFKVNELLLLRLVLRVQIDYGLLSLFHYLKVKT